MTNSRQLTPQTAGPTPGITEAEPRRTARSPAGPGEAAATGPSTGAALRADTDIARSRPARSSGRGEYDFLIGTLVDAPTLKMAHAIAWHWGVPLHDALITLGWVSAGDYTAALGNEMGLMVVDTPVVLEPFAQPCETIPFSGVISVVVDGPRHAKADANILASNHQRFFALESTSMTPDEIRALLAQSGFGHRQVVLVPPAALRQCIEAANSQSMLDNAVNSLRRQRPDYSTGNPVWLWQSLSIVCLLGLTIGGMAGAPLLTTLVVTGAMTVPFLCVVILRLTALIETIARRDSNIPPDLRINDAQLPVYSILVPVFRELEILPDLINALRAIDYPAAKLDILIVLEGIDHEMQKALAELDLPPQFRVVVVPDAQPRTKPKALNYALQLARGDYVVVYDAEDLPEPDQLRKAVTHFAQNNAKPVCDALAKTAPGVAKLGCLQARLNIYNPNDSWLSAQFTIEYSALFDALLPAFERLAIPIPLGGTSNHFPRKVLDEIGGWDPFNVTEDADLGIRLVRLGYSVQMLASTTWEEAPTSLTVWMKQRTRWLKGWMQTYLVHTRRPIILARDMGTWRSFGFHILMGGILISALVHPLFYLMVAMDLYFDRFLTTPGNPLGWALLWIAGINLTVGYVSSIVLGGLAVARRKRPALALHALAMPLYWLLVSFAAYRAIWQLARTPYKWEKTDHRARRRRDMASGL